jgi:hypothetical protein
VQEYHWYVNTGSGKPAQVPSVAVIVSPEVRSAEIVGSERFLGASVTWLDATVDAYVGPLLLVALFEAMC